MTTASMTPAWARWADGAGDFIGVLQDVDRLSAAVRDGPAFCRSGVRGTWKRRISGLQAREAETEIVDTLGASGLFVA